MVISDLKIGDIVYYQATEKELEDTLQTMKHVEFGVVGGGLDEPNSYYGITPLGDYLRTSYDLMNRSRREKIRVKIIRTDPLMVEPLLVYQRNERDNDLYYFPKFIVGRLYDLNNQLIEFYN